MLKTDGSTWITPPVGGQVSVDGKIQMDQRKPNLGSSCSPGKKHTGHVVFETIVVAARRARDDAALHACA